MNFRGGAIGGANQKGLVGLVRAFSTTASQKTVAFSELKTVRRDFSLLVGARSSRY
jgi:hypothetical protein